ncbi:hypothetical protein DCC62_06755 [candidate division KSB1 bacterium]|nr:MAG: hypothetical protein DCC62_06755 [candidate division KSB1 bacterium]
MKRKIYLGILVLLSIALSGGSLSAQHHHEQESKAGHSHAKAEIHGGEAAMTKAHHFEVVWMPDHVMVYLYDQNQKPLAAKGVSGEVIFKFKDGKEQKATLALMEAGKMMADHTEDEKHEKQHGQMSKEKLEAMHKLMSNQDHLTASVDLGNAEEGEVKATFTLKGLPGKGESEATFATKYKKMSMKHHDAEKHGEHH